MLTGVSCMSHSSSSIGLSSVTNHCLSVPLPPWHSPDLTPLSSSPASSPARYTLPSRDTAVCALLVRTSLKPSDASGPATRAPAALPSGFDDTQRQCDTVVFTLVYEHLRTHNGQPQDHLQHRSTQQTMHSMLFRPRDTSVRASKHTNSLICKYRTVSATNLAHSRYSSCRRSHWGAPTVTTRQPQLAKPSVIKR
jgi:hypothetical protein